MNDSSAKTWLITGHHAASAGSSPKAALGRGDNAAWEDMAVRAFRR